MTDPRLQPRVEIVEYDSEKGVVRHIDEAITSEIEIRQGLIDKVVRIAAIAELEKLGYTIITPEEGHP